MTTYNTGNPIGSTDARDRLDNTENMDYLENSTTKLTHPDRLGTVRKTRHGMEAEHDAQISAHKVEHDNQMQSFESDFDGRLAGMAFTRVGSFTAGATLTDMRQVLVWEVSQGGDGHEYGWSGAFPKVVAAGSIPATSGGIGVGAWVDRTDVALRPSVIEALRRSYAEAGYNLVEGSFEAGGALVNSNDVLLHEASGKAFSGPAGTVAAGTNPASGGFVDKSGVATSASAISNANGGSVQDFIDAQYTTVAELATGKFQVGTYVRLTDRAMGLFLLQSGGTPDGYSILDAGNGNTAVLDDISEIDPAWLGAKTTGDVSLELQAALDTGLHIDGKGRKYSAVGLIDSSDLRRISDITLIKSGNGTVLSSSGRAPQFSNLLIEGLNGFTGDNWVITGDNADLLNCGSKTNGGGLALRAEGNGTNVAGSKEAYQSVGQPFSIQIGNGITQTLYAKLTGVDTQTGGGIRWVKHGTASIVGGQIGGSTVEFGSYQIWHSDCRFNGDVILNGSGGIESSSISGNLTIGNGTNAISQVTISDDVVVQSGYTVTLNANVRESSINLAQIAEVGGITIVDNLTGTANDVGNSIYLPPVAYSPNWTATTTQPSIGNGSLTGYYTRSGKTISVNIALTWGTTTNGGAGDWFFSVPKASGPYGNSVGSVLALDSGTGYSNGNAILPPSSSLISQYVGPEPIAGRTRFNRPFTWANGDDFKMSLSYQTN